MARRPRLEVEGGLYHIITRGVDRRDIFHAPEDRRKFLILMAAIKEKLPFFLYGYCLMTNHIHLLIERRIDDVGRIMHRVLTGYTQYYNRKYRRSGHLLQGRHKAILCQSDPYLAELVRYIHLNPIRAKMVDRPADYPWSSHGAYMGIEPYGIVDVEPVLRRFGPSKAVARQRFAQHVAAGMGLGHLDIFYATKEGVLGSEEFIDSMIHRIGEFVPKGTPAVKRDERIDADALISAVEAVCGLARADFCGFAKSSQVVAAKELTIVSGRRLGFSATTLANLTGLSIGTVSRRHDAALRRIQDDKTYSEMAGRVMEIYDSWSQNKSPESKA